MSLPPQIAKAIHEFKNRPIYKQLTLELLASIPDDKIEQAIVDYIGVKIGDKDEYATIIGMSPTFRAIYVTWVAEAEIFNGGFNQFFWNSTSQFAEEAVYGFHRIGAEQHSQLMKRAIFIYLQEEARLQQYKSVETLEAFSESYEENPLNDLDEEFNALEENLKNLRIAFIRTHPELFVGD